METIIQENGGMFITSNVASEHTEAIAISSMISESSPPLTPLQTYQPSPITIRKSAEAEDVSLSASPSKANGKLPSWLNFLYQRTSSNATFPSGSAAKPETQSPPVKKGILKKSKPIDYEALERICAEQVIIQKSATLTPKEIRKLTVQNTNQTVIETEIIKRQRLCRFSPLVQVGEAHSKDDYDRGAIEYIAKSLTPALALAIKQELNEVKSEMPVHQESTIYTQFYPLPQKPTRNE